MGRRTILLARQSEKITQSKFFPQIIPHDNK